MPSSQEIARVMAEMDRFNQTAKMTVTEERYEKRVASVGGSYGGLTALLQQGAPGNWASDHKSEAEKFAGWHYVAISSIGKAVRSANCEAYQEKVREYAKAYNEQDDDSEPLQKWHPLMKLLKRPNPSQSGASFREEVAIQLCLTGSALIWNVPNQMGRTVERYIIPTAIAEPRQPERGRPKGGWYINPEVARWQIESGWFLYTGLATAIGKVIDARDVQVIRFIHPVFKDEGQSPVSAGALWTDTSEKVDISRHSHLRNGSDPSVIIGIDGVEDEGTLQRMSAKFNEKYAGPSKHGKAMFVNGQNVKVEPVTRTPAEMAYEGAFVQFRDAIMALHGVTPIAAGIEAPSGDDGLYAPLKQFISGTVQPILDLMAEEDTEQLAGQFGEGISVLYTAKAIDDAKLTEQQINTDIAAGAIEVDEIRKLRGRKPWGGEKGKAVAGQGAKEEPKPGLPGLAQGVPGLEPQTGSQALDPSKPPQGTPDPMKLAEEAVAKALGGFADRLSALLKTGDNCGTGAGGFQEGNTCGQRRAKKGGQVGMNGEFYAGGQFLPSTDMPKRVKAEMDRIASGKVKIDEGVFEKLQPGEFAPYQMIGTFLQAAGRDKEGRLQVKQNNDTALAYLGVDTQEKASKLQNIVNRFNAGERKLSIYDYPSFTNGADIIRALSANLPVPESMIGKLQPNIAKFVTRNGEATAKAKSGDNCGTGAGGFKPGNDCARGGGESSDAPEKKKRGKKAGKSEPKEFWEMTPVEFRRANNQALVDALTDTSSYGAMRYVKPGELRVGENGQLEIKRVPPGGKLKDKPTWNRLSDGEEEILREKLGVESRDHEGEIEQAIQSGKPVPKEVAEYYPKNDLIYEHFSSKPSSSPGRANESGGSGNKFTYWIDTGKERDITDEVLDYVNSIYKLPASDRDDLASELFNKIPISRADYDKLTEEAANIDPKYGKWMESRVDLQRERDMEKDAAREAYLQELRDSVNKPKRRTRKKFFFKSSDCGANAEGGGGFQPGNTCGRGDGSGESGGEGKASKKKPVKKGKAKGVLAWAEEKFGDSEKAKAFADWFGESKVVDEDGNPEETAPIPVYHGTTHDFEEFDLDRANVESDMGAGHYFSSDVGDSEANYAGEGPDLTSRIEQLADQLEGEFGDEYDVDEISDRLELPSDRVQEIIDGAEDDREVAKELAREKLVGGEAKVITAYLKMEKPVVLGDPKWGKEVRRAEKGETFFDFEYDEVDADGRRPDDPDFDPDTSEIQGYKGKLADLLDAVRNQAANYNEVGDGLEDDLAELQSTAADYGGFRAGELVSRLKSMESLAYATNDDGKLVSGTIVGHALRDMGFDGIVYKDAAQHFPNFGARGDGKAIKPGTRHYVIWDSRQIKAANNQGTFDPSNPNIYKSGSSCGANAEGGGGFQPGNTCGKRDGKGSESSEGGGKGAGVNPKVLAWAREKFGDDTTAENFAKWFGDSKVVDAEGNPLTVYHGTGKTGFTEFNSGSTLGLFGDGQYFTDSAEVASEYSDKENATNAQGGPGVYAVHLRIEKPFDMDKEYSREQAIKLAQDLVKNTPIINQETDKPYKKSALLDALKDRIENGVFDSYGVKKKGKDKWSDGAQTLTGEDVWSAVAHVGSRFSDGAIGAREKLFGNSYAQKAVAKAGHDGIKHTGGGRFYRHDVGEHKVYITFSATQIKSATGNSGTFDPKDPNITKSAASDSYNPPESARNNARKVLRWKEQHGDAVRGMTATGWARANQLASGERLSRETVGRMAAFARHRKNSKVDPKFRDEPWRDAGYVAWLGWGGDSGINWAAGVVSGEGKSGSGCGANAEGGGGFQRGNTCGSREGGDSEGSGGSNPGRGGKVYEWALKKFKDEETARNFTKWFGDSKVVDQDGNPLTIYHGTTGDFTEFDPRASIKSGQEFGAGIYLTTDAERAALYANDEGGSIKPLYLKAESVLDRDGELSEAQAESISRVLSEDILPEDLSYHTSTRAKRTFKDKDEARAFYQQQKQEWDQSGEGVARYKPSVSRSTLGIDDEFVVEYSDKEKVSIMRGGRDAVSQLMRTYGNDYTFALSRAGVDAVKVGDIYVVTSPNQVKSATGNSGKFDPSSGDITKSSDCGANGPGGGGFQPGNTCGKEDGAGEAAQSPEVSRQRKQKEKRTRERLYLEAELMRATGWTAEELNSKTEHLNSASEIDAWVKDELSKRQTGAFAEARKAVKPELDKLRAKVVEVWEKDMDKINELNKQFAEEADRHDKLNRKHMDLYLAHKQMRDSMGNSEQELAEYSRLGKEMDAAAKEAKAQGDVARKIWEQKNKIPDKTREKIAAVLRKESARIAEEISPEFAEQFKLTEKNIEEWVKRDYALVVAGNSTEQDKKTRQKSLEFLATAANPEFHNLALKSAVNYKDGVRANANPGVNTERLGKLLDSGVAAKEAIFQSRVPSYSVFAPGDELRTYIHEMGHQIEFGSREAAEYANDFLSRRTSGDEVVSFADQFGAHYRPDEKGSDDEFGKAIQSVFAASYGKTSVEMLANYTGKIYSDGSTEVLSIGLELLHENPKAFAEADPEWFDLVSGVLTGRVLTRTKEEARAKYQ